jgi:hypothetical protein
MLELDIVDLIDVENPLFFRLSEGSFNDMSCSLPTTTLALDKLSANNDQIKDAWVDYSVAFLVSRGLITEFAMNFVGHGAANGK